MLILFPMKVAIFVGIFHIPDKATSSFRLPLLWRLPEDADRFQRRPSISPPWNSAVTAGHGICGKALCALYHRRLMGVSSKHVHLFLRVPNVGPRNGTSVFTQEMKLRKPTLGFASGLFWQAGSGTRRTSLGLTYNSVLVGPQD